MSRCLNGARVGLSGSDHSPLRSALPAQLAHQFQCARNVAASAISPGKAAVSKSCRRGRCRFVRFIPAHAGNRLRFQCATVPPRMRGTGIHPAPFSSGSSPRMRGTDAVKTLVRGRFIPAHAGNIVLHTRFPSGSSPRMRGTESGTSLTNHRSVLTVHPRACGEQRTVIASLSTVHMRGTASSISVHPRACGEQRKVLIPAPLWSVRPVHPRACGEQPARSREPASSPPCGEVVRIGSSPRMRGTGARRSHDRRHDRFIPAHAGNSRAIRRS